MPSSSSAWCGGNFPAAPASSASKVEGSPTPALTGAHGSDIIASQHLDIRLSPAYSAGMRTTLDIDEDVLRAAKSIARAQETSLGRVVSSFVRKRLAPKTPARKGGFPGFRIR